MFFNSDLLTKRGALAQVWMASHLSSKLSKQALTSTSIPKSVQSILGQELLPMALRLSGQLLLGIARIYSRKSKYLLDDAQETLQKVKKAFQNDTRAAVDLPDEGAARGAGDDGAARGKDINLRREGGDFEDMLALEFADGEWSLEKHLAAAAAAKEKGDKGKGKQKALTANIADITLDESFAHDFTSGDLFSGIDGLGGGDLDLDLGLGDNMAFDPDFALFEDDAELNALAGAGPSGEKRPKKRSREDGEEGEEGDEDDLSVEMGRDAAPHASSERGLSMGPLDIGFGKDGEGDVAMGDDLGGFDGGDAAFDLGLDMGFGDGNNEFGGGFDDFGAGDREKTPTAPSLAGDDATSLQLTPRAAAEVAARTQKQQQQKEKNERGEPPKKRAKALAVDKVIELDWEKGRLEGKERFKDPEFLPSSRLHLALLTSGTSALLPRALPKASKNATAFELFAPPGFLAPELQELYKMPTRRDQIKLEGRERGKLADADKEVELGRRAGSVFSNLSNIRDGVNLDGLDNFDLNNDFGGGFDDFAGVGDDLGGFDGDHQLDAADLEDGFKTPTKSQRERAAKKQKTAHGDERDGSRAGSIFGDDPLATPARSVLSNLTRDDLPQYKSEGPLAVFDEVGSGVAGAAASVAGTGTPSRAESQSQTQGASGLSQSLGTTEEGDAAETLTQRTGSVSLQSRNTRKAVRVLKSELLEVVGEEEQPAQQEEERKLEFGKVAQRASRRAASSFFFELLVLSSADVVKINQPSAYGEIEVRATEKLREIAV
ncbi:hypothetical protein JCM10207_005171 [Rhodosporidiobolus poonsookiae]